MACLNTRHLLWNSLLSNILPFQAPDYSHDNHEKGLEHFEDKY